MKVRINRKCKTCEWAFGQYNERDRSYNKNNIDFYICAGHSDVVKYGDKINDLNMKCGCWEPGLEYFTTLSKRLEKYENADLVLKYEASLGFNFNMLKKVKNGKYFFKINENIMAGKIFNIFKSKKNGENIEVVKGFESDLADYLKKYMVDELVCSINCKDKEKIRYIFELGKSQTRSRKYSFITNIPLSSKDFKN